MERIARRHTGSYPITFSVTDADGAPVTVTSPAIDILDGAGVSVFGTAPTVTPTEGLLSTSVPIADLEHLDSYKAIWSGSVGDEEQEWHSYFELVGDNVFHIEDLREFDTSFADEEAYPDAALQAARTWAEQRFEEAAHVAFVPRGKRAVVMGTGTDTVFLPTVACRSLVSVSVNGTALDTSSLVLWESGKLVNPSLWTASARIDVHYEHGYTVAPEPVKRAVLLLAKEALAESALSSRAISESTDAGFIRLSIAAPGGRIGIPEVDAVAADFGRKPVWIG